MKRLLLGLLLALGVLAALPQSVSAQYNPGNYRPAYTPYMQNSSSPPGYYVYPSQRSFVMRTPSRYWVPDTAGSRYWGPAYTYQRPAPDWREVLLRNEVPPYFYETFPSVYRGR